MSPLHPADFAYSPNSSAARVLYSTIPARIGTLPAGFRHHRIQHGLALAHGERERLSRTAQRDQTVDALGKQEPYERASSAEADAFVFLKRSDGRGIHAPRRKNISQPLWTTKPPHTAGRVRAEVVVAGCNPASSRTLA